MHYDSEEDFRNPTGSVFCAHGSGYVVPWDEVPEHMHLPYVYHGDESEEALAASAPYAECIFSGGCAGACRKPPQDEL